MAAYVKFMESAGARVVPLIMGEPLEVTLEKVSKLSGVLFPGGGGDYIEFGRPIYEAILEANDQGHFYPAWGTCLGLEALATWASSDGRDVLTHLEAEHVSLPLFFTADPLETKMFAGLGLSAYWFENLPVTLNAHSFGVDPTRFTDDEGLKSIFTLTSVSFEPEGDGNPFTATMESDRYPIMGTQFHPEKTVTMFNDNQGVNHSWESIQLNSYFAENFLE